MQIGYRYLLTKPAGRCFHPDFRPGLTPKQMLELGVFGGKYMTDCRDEFPPSWFRKAKLSPLRANPILNYFGVGASKPLSYWVEKGWIHPQDPRGWFQWYCRYYMGEPVALCAGARGARGWREGGLDAGGRMNGARRMPGRRIARENRAETGGARRSRAHGVAPHGVAPRGPRGSPGLVDAG